jgi:hypothetical protein
MTLSGIEPATCRLVAQCLNCATVCSCTVRYYCTYFTDHRVQLKAGSKLVGCGHFPVHGWAKKTILVVARGGNQVSDVDGIPQCSRLHYVAYAILMHSGEYK